jgi:hypothetical protein
MNKQQPPQQQQQKAAARAASSQPSGSAGATPDAVPRAAHSTVQAEQRNVWIEPELSADSDASLLFEWHLRELGSNRTWGCKVTAADGHAIAVKLSQPPYERSLQGEGIVELVAIPVAAPGTKGSLSARDEVTGATAQFSWVWRQASNGRPAKPKAPAARAKPAAAKKNTTQSAARNTTAQTQAVHDANVTAPQAFFGMSITGNRVAFILDKSGSMSGGRWNACARQLQAALTDLQEGTQFFVVLYSDSLTEPPGQRGWNTATPARVGAVIEWLNRIHPEGGTEPRPAFDRVFRLPGRPQSIYFLTDGEFSGFGAEECQRLQRYGSTSKFGAAIGTVARWFSPSASTPDSPVAINAVTLDDGSSGEVLQNIADSSGGRYIHSVSGRAETS